MVKREVEDIPQNYSLIELQENEKEIELLIINDKKKKEGVRLAHRSLRRLETE